MWTPAISHWLLPFPASDEWRVTSRNISVLRSKIPPGFGKCLLGRWLWPIFFGFLTWLIAFREIGGGLWGNGVDPHIVSTRLMRVLIKSVLTFIVHDWLIWVIYSHISVLTGVFFWWAKIRSRQGCVRIYGFKFEAIGVISLGIIAQFFIVGYGYKFNCSFKAELYQFPNNWSFKPLWDMPWEFEFYGGHSKDQSILEFQSSSHRYWPLKF